MCYETLLVGIGIQFSLQFRVFYACIRNLFIYLNNKAKSNVQSKRIFDFCIPPTHLHKTLQA